MTAIPAILASLDADTLRAEARSSPTLLGLIRGLVGRDCFAWDHHSEGVGICHHCRRGFDWDGHDYRREHEPDCPYVAADAALKAIGE